MKHEPGTRAWYIDAMRHRVNCTVVRDEGPHGRIYVKIDRVKGEVWFDADERDRLTIIDTQLTPTTAQPGKARRGK